MAPKMKAKNMRATQLQQTMKLKLEFIEHQKQNIIDLIEAFVDQVKSETVQACKKDSVFSVNYHSMTQKLDQTSKTLEDLANTIIENTAFEDNGRNDSDDSPDVEIENEEDDTTGNENLVCASQGISSMGTADSLQCFDGHTGEDQFIPQSKSIPENYSECFAGAHSLSHSASEKGSSLSNVDQGLFSQSQEQTSGNVQMYSSLPPSSRFEQNSVPVYSRDIPPPLNPVPYQQERITNFSSQPLSFQPVEPQNYYINNSLSHNSLQGTVPVPPVQHRWPAIQSNAVLPPNMNNVFPPPQSAMLWNTQKSFRLPLAMRQPNSFPLCRNQSFNLHQRQPLFFPFDSEHQYIFQPETTPFVPDQYVSDADPTDVSYQFVPNKGSIISDPAYCEELTSLSCSQTDLASGKESHADIRNMSPSPELSTSFPNVRSLAFQPRKPHPFNTELPEKFPTPYDTGLLNIVTDSHSNPSIESPRTGEDDFQISLQPQMVETKAEESSAEAPKPPEFNEMEEEKTLQNLLKKLNVSLNLSSQETESSENNIQSPNQHDNFNANMDTHSKTLNKEISKSLSSHNSSEFLVDGRQPHELHRFEDLDFNTTTNQEGLRITGFESLSIPKSSELPIEGWKRCDDRNQFDNFDTFVIAQKEGTLQNMHDSSHFPSESSANAALPVRNRSELPSRFNKTDAVSIKNEDDDVDDTMSCTSLGSVTKLIEEQSKISHSITSAHPKGSKAASNILEQMPTKDTILAGKVINVKHPWSFNVQLSGRIDAIQKQIEKLQQDGECHVPCARPVPGMLCLAVYPEDGQLYRAKIVEVEGATVNALFIDLGSEVPVLQSKVFVMPTELMAQPAIAMLCALTGAAPLNEEGMWTETAILKFQDLVCDRIIQMRVVHPCSKNAPTGTPQLVNLVFKTKVSSRSGLGSVSKPVRVSSELIRQGCAKNISVQEQITKLHETKKNITLEPLGRLKELKTLLAASKSSTNNKIDSKNASNPVPPCFNFKRPAPLSFHNFAKPSSKTSVTFHSSFPAPDKSRNKQSSPTPSAPTPEELNIFNLGNTVSTKLIHLGQMMKRRMPRDQCLDDLECLSDDSQETNGLSEAKSSGLSHKEMEKEYELPVMMSTVISPNSFFVHVVNAETAHTLNALEQELMSSFQGVSNDRKASEWPNFTPKKYHFCCAQFSSTKGFYRGLVLENNSTDDMQKFLIFFMDYGDFEWVPENKIYPLPEQYESISPLVLWCTLSYVLPQQTPAAASGPGSDHGKDNASDKWSLQAVTKFKAMAGDSERLAVILSNKSLKRLNDSSHFQMEPLPVYLLDRSNPGEEICLNHQLIHKDLAAIGSSLTASSSVNTPESDQVLGDEDWDPMATDFNSMRNSYKVDTDDPGVALVGYKSGDNQLGARRVCVFYNSRSKCFKGKRCPYLHIKCDNKDGLSYDQLPVLQFDQDQSDLLPRPNSLVLVTVSTVVSPSLFYVTLVWGNLTLNQVQSDPSAVQNYTKGETLESLMDSLESFYHGSVYNGDTTTLAFGEAVVAYIKGKWMRSKVVDTDADDSLVQVYCIDFGDTQWIHEKDVRELDLRFIHLSPQAVECCLDGVEPTQESDSTIWTADATDLFVQLVSDKSLIGIIQKRFLSGRIVLSLIDNTDGKELDIATELIRVGKGIAAKAKFVDCKKEGVKNEKKSSSAVQKDGEFTLFPA